MPVLTARAYAHLLSSARTLDRRPAPQSPTKREIETWRMVHLPVGEDSLKSRLNRYVEASVANECAHLSKVVNEHIQEDGIEAFRRTFASGLRKGAQGGDVVLEKIRDRMQKSGR